MLLVSKAAVKFGLYICAAVRRSFLQWCPVSVPVLMYRSLITYFIHKILKTNFYEVL